MMKQWICLCSRSSCYIYFMSSAVQLEKIWLRKSQIYFGGFPLQDFRVYMWSFFRQGSFEKLYLRTLDNVYTLIGRSYGNYFKNDFLNYSLSDNFSKFEQKSELNLSSLIPRTILFRSRLGRSLTLLISLFNNPYAWLSKQISISSYKG